MRLPQTSTHAVHGGVAHGSGASMLHTCAKSIFPSRDSQSLTPNESTRFPPASVRFDASWVPCCEASHLGCQEVCDTYGTRAAGRYSSPPTPLSPGASCPAPLGTHNTQKAGTVRSPQGRRCQHSLSREARDELHRLAIGAVLHRTRAELCRGGEQLVRRHLLENSEPPR